MIFSVSKRWLAALIMGLTICAPTHAADNPRMVFAHWLIPMNYVAGETGAQRSMDDIDAAMEMGINGFVFDAFSGKQAVGMMSSYSNAADAIHADNFKFFLSADMSLGFQPEDIVDAVKQFANNPHYAKIDGKPILSTYGGDKFDDQWWQENVLTPLREDGIQVVFLPYFDRPRPNSDTPNYENWTKVIQTHPSIDGLFTFAAPGSTPFYSGDPRIGHHWWSILEAQEALAQALRDNGKIYMAPYSPYYWAVCHPVRQYIEDQGGHGLDNWWKSIIEKQKPEIVEIITWNDYSESTYVQPTRIPETKTKGLPSTPHLGYYELLKYYINWYRTGSEPRITKDALFYFYRLHPDAAIATDDGKYCHLGPISSNQKWGKIEDMIYVTTALTAPAQLMVKIGDRTTSYDVPAGLHTTDVPFTAGTPHLALIRQSKIIMDSIGQDTINAHPDIYNYNVSSGFAIAGGNNSASWVPGRGWKNDHTAQWFSPNGKKP